ncbi:hypothetical protein CMV_013843 [Castanea mollissima]|uniref:Disease resistance R13L4/SHOC-2-like LRR domain-containing protein n=1 Tax=Castanea mollissima TaxID=60419 RepID=A0A8J4RCC6_9ROSI|nr:hypothetical protein CMV_013843 [Castanea mollissima]
MAHKVKDIRARLDEVAADRFKFHLSPRSDDRNVVRGREMSYSFVQASDVIGRGQDKDKIVEYLMDPSDGQSISVVPVVGIGGLGKTALAKLNDNVLKCLQKSKSLRTILSVVEGVGPSTKSFVDSCVSKFRYLRVLDLSDSSFEVLPSSIGTMKHLRLLDLSSNCRIHKLPNSICKLQNLEVLDLSGCEKLEELPKDIRYLIKLRIFFVTTKQKFLSGCPNSLRILALSNCGNLESLVETMQVCTSLRVLGIDNCGGLISLLPILKFLTTLETLVIENCEKLDLIEMEDNQDDFPTSLRALGFTGLPQLVAMPDWIKRSAISLQILVIDSCPNLTAFPEWLIHNVIMLMIILIVEISFIDPNLEDNNVTISNGAIVETRNFRLSNL